MRKYLVFYTLLSVAVAVPAGYYSSAFTAANKGLFSNLVIFFAVVTIYPSMIQLKTEGLAKSFRSWHPGTEWRRRSFPLRRGTTLRKPTALTDPTLRSQRTTARKSERCSL